MSPLGNYVYVLGAKELVAGNSMYTIDLRTLRTRSVGGESPQVVDPSTDRQLQEGLRRGIDAESRRERTADPGAVPTNPDLPGTVPPSESQAQVRQAFLRRFASARLDSRSS